MVKVLFIEGNIGSGKSTTISHLQSTLKASKSQPIFIAEPIDQWQNVPTEEGNTINLLDEFYNNISKYSFCFQTYTFQSRMNILLQALKQAKEENREWIICERSIFTDREIFLESLFIGGNITLVERAAYHSNWTFWTNMLQPFFENVQIHFLYLDCPPPKAHSHIKTRNRPEEKNIDSKYLDQLHQRHHSLYFEAPQLKLQQLIKTLKDKDFKANKLNNEVIVHILTNQSDKTAFLSSIDSIWISLNTK